ncbi:MAG TPA: fatty acid--CoA ligase family protein [Amycolatopsis sp.]|nr:fatty acid--CoA ligase family protein [Amycolatopsis sp.]
MDVSARIGTVLGLDEHRPAAYFEGSWDTWGQVRRRVERLDHLLSTAGLGAGQPVGLVTRNRPGHLCAIQALLSTRRCVVPISSIATDELVADDVARLGVPAVIAAPGDWSRAGLVDRCQALGVLGIEISGDARLVPGLEVARLRAEPLDGVAVLMPTSGTTGPPKRIRYTYDQINGALDRVARYSAATSRSLAGPPELRSGVLLSHLTLAHVGGFWAVVQGSAEGRPIALLERFEPHAWADLVAEHRVKTSALPPAMLRMVLDADVDPAKLRSLAAVGCGTAPLDPGTADKFTDRYGIPVLTAYGATEFPGGTVGWTLENYRQHWTRKRGSAGRARPGIGVRIVDPETGAVLPPGEEGILAIRSPQAATRTPDGWVRTNDLGRLDADGFLWLVGRADDAINRGGFKIVPQVVEAVLADHPAVTDAGVVGLPDDRLGEVPVAAVTVRAPVAEEELRAWVRKHLASYQVPAEIRVVEELPRTASLKVAKAELRKLLGQRAASDVSSL